MRQRQCTNKDAQCSWLIDQQPPCNMVAAYITRILFPY